MHGKILRKEMISGCTGNPLKRSKGISFKVSAESICLEEESGNPYEKSPLPPGFRAANVRLGQITEWRS